MRRDRRFRKETSLIELRFSLRRSAMLVQLAAKELALVPEVEMRRSVFVVTSVLIAKRTPLINQGKWNEIVNFNGRFDWLSSNFYETLVNRDSR